MKEKTIWHVVVKSDLGWEVWTYETKKEAEGESMELRGQYKEHNPTVWEIVEGMLIEEDS